MIILLVDDDDTDVQLVHHTLRRQDPEIAVLEARTCEEALAITARQTIDCIVMDQKLVGTSGTECIKKLRESKYVGAFILLTGFSDIRTAVEAIKTGADHFLSKDHMHDELLIEIRAAIESRAQAVQAQGEAEEKGKRFDAMVDELDAWLERLKRARRGP